MNRKGNLLFLFLGAFGLLAVLAVSLFGRFRIHVKSVTLIDQGLIARYFLESLTDDILKQLKDQYEKKNGLFFERASEWLKTSAAVSLTEFRASQLGCSPGKMVKKIADNYSGSEKLAFEYDSDPRISFSNWKELEPPKIFSMAPNSFWPEKEGFIAIESSASIQGRKYHLKISRRFKFLMRMIPVLKDFAFFFDALHEEQNIQTSGAGDNINIIPLDYGELQSNSNFPFSLSTFCEGIGTKILLNPDLNGKVFLGDEDHLMVLNMGGEVELKLKKGRYSDLGLIRKNHFDVPSDPLEDIFKPDALHSFKALSLENLELFAKSDDIVAQLRSIRALRVNTIDENTMAPNPYVTATLFVLGFGNELLTDNPNGLFFQSGWNIDSFVSKDPALKYIRSTEAIKMSSAIRPYGLSSDWRVVLGLSASSGLAKAGWQQILDIGTTLIPYRQIFGPLARRFIILSYFNQGSIDSALPYMSSEEYKPIEVAKPGFINKKYTFNPPGPGTKDNYQNYAKLMSRIVSGDIGRLHEFTAESPKFPDGFEGFELEYENNSLPRTKPRSAHDFKSSEGIVFSFGSRFSNIKDFISLEDASDTTINGLKNRVTGYYKNAREFLKKALRTDEKGNQCFDASGISYIDGDLDLQQGINAEIYGGIVLVNGSLILGNVDHGLENVSEAEIYKLASEIKQSNFLTFVVNPSSGKNITLTGDKYIGVQLVMLSKTLPTPIIPKNPFLFVGGIALSRPNLIELSKSLKSGNKETVFYFCPCMGTPPPELFFDVNSVNISFEFGLR
ncbi:MAG: hypothetical protein HQM08_16565 [Candidatus Riflebacteria bacterium]|nr:hypothetical protein [Candidatus Riflebacteria bacterium]